MTYNKAKVLDYSNEMIGLPHQVATHKKKERGACDIKGLKKKKKKKKHFIRSS
jgi:hypothetical protein